MWPVTLVLLALGVFGGVFAATSMRQSYVSTVKILVVNSDTGVISTDYVGLLNSPVVISAARDNVGADEECTLQSTGSGNVLTIVASCFSSEEDSEKFAAETIAVFTQKIENLYGSDSVAVDNLFDEIKAVKALSEQDFAARIIMMIAAGLLLSGVIAFVRFDYTNSKQRKK